MPSKIVIVGASGLLGTCLSDFLSKEGYDIIAISHKSLPKELPEAFAVINLAGANIAGHFWTKKYKEEIVASRVNITKKIAKALSPKTRLFISASGISYYGSRGSEVMTESSEKGSGFLSDVSEKWEEASKSITSCRRVLARTAPVLTPKSGFLGPLQTLFRLGLGAKIGSGEQWQSWIHYTDFARAMLHIIQTPSLKGPVIIASPEPVRQKRFGKQLSKTLKRPFLLKVPASLLRLLPGQMADELFLSSIRTEPLKLIDSNFHFLYRTLPSGVSDLLR